MEEIWKDIEGYEGLYQVSNYGRVRSLPRVSKSINKTYGGKILKVYTSNMLTKSSNHSSND